MVSYIPQVREEQMVSICSAHGCGCMIDGSGAIW